MRQMDGQEEVPLDPAHRLVAEQEALTSAQEAEMRRFTDAYIQTQSSSPSQRTSSHAIQRRPQMGWP